MGNLCMRAGRGHHHEHNIKQPVRTPSGRIPGHSDADASFIPVVKSVENDGAAPAKVKHRHRADPRAMDYAEGDYPPPMEPALRRRSSVKAELENTDAALLKVGDAGYPPAMPATVGKSAKQVRAELERDGPIARRNNDL